MNENEKKARKFLWKSVICFECSKINFLRLRLYIFFCDWLARREALAASESALIRNERISSSRWRIFSLRNQNKHVKSNAKTSIIIDDRNICNVRFHLPQILDDFIVLGFDEFSFLLRDHAFLQQCLVCLCAFLITLLHKFELLLHFSRFALDVFLVLIEKYKQMNRLHATLSVDSHRISLRRNQQSFANVVPLPSSLPSVFYRFQPNHGVCCESCSTLCRHCWSFRNWTWPPFQTGGSNPIPSDALKITHSVSFSVRNCVTKKTISSASALNCYNSIVHNNQWILTIKVAHYFLRNTRVQCLAQFTSNLHKVLYLFEKRKICALIFIVLSYLQSNWVLN